MFHIKVNININYLAEKINLGSSNIKSDIPMILKYHMDLP